MTTRLLTVTIESEVAAYVRGYGSRELLTRLRGGRPPVYSTTRRAWVCQAKTARDAVALAEARGWNVEVVGGGAAESVAVATSSEAERLEERLW